MAGKEAGVADAGAAAEEHPCVDLAVLFAVLLGVCRVEAATAARFPPPPVPGVQVVFLTRAAGFLATVVLPATAFGCSLVATDGCRGSVQAKTSTGNNHRHDASAKAVTQQ